MTARRSPPTVAALLTLLSLLLAPAHWAYATTDASTSGKRIALVIGNSHYSQLRDLSNPSGDAQAVAAKLEALGFTLIGRDGKPTDQAVLNLGENAFSTTVKRFARTARGAEIALIYCAGHGMQMGQQSYLLPVDVPSDDLELIQRHAISLDHVLRRLDGKAKLTVAVFDACREIPELEQLIEEELPRGGLSPAAYRGLARVKSRGRSRIVAFAGAAGELVADGRGQHSPYTETLLAELAQPELEVGDLFRQVAWNFGQTRGGQQPEVLIQGVPPRQFYFIPGGIPAPAPVPVPVPAPPPLPTGYLQVLVDVPSAEVSVNDRRVGEAGSGRPLNLSSGLPAGSVTIHVQAGDQQRQRREAIRPGQWTQAWFSLHSAAVSPAAPAPAANPAPVANPAPAVSTPQPDPAAIEQALGLNRNERHQVQQALNALDIAVGGADGVWGARTRRGIDRWQQRQGQPASGYLDAAGYKALLAEAQPRLAAAQARAKAEADRHQPGQRFHDALRGGGQGPEMVVIPAGSFQMGSNNGDNDEKPVHRVRISRAFALGRTEVTFADYDRFCDATGRDKPGDSGWGRGSRPVINVSWHDAVAYAQWLSSQTGERYRLPTEAEWEYAARAGSSTDYWWGSAIGNNRANCDGCGSYWDNKKSAPVGSFAANPFGLYDTAGNAWEWVADWYADSYPPRTRTDPTGPASGSDPVQRGGSWISAPRELRSAYRNKFDPGFRYFLSGFRLARTL